MLLYIRKKLHEKKMYSRTVRERSSLSHREMQDLGINGADIHFIARAASQESVRKKFGE